MKWRTDKPTANLIVAKLNNGNYSILERLSSGKYCVQDKSIGYDILHGENMVFIYEEEIQKWADLEEEEKGIDVTDFCQPIAEREALETLIPELAESEDEKIRKELLCHIQGEIDTYDNMISGDYDSRDKEDKKVHSMLKRAKAYLEKQKERGPLSKDEEYTLARIIEYLEDNDCPSEWKDLLHDVYSLPYQKEQKPAEQNTREQIISKATTERQVVLISESNDRAEINWDTCSLGNTKALLECGLTFINKQLGIESSESIPQSKQEWSKEDKTTLNNIIWAIHMKSISHLDEMDDRDKYKRYENFLKSLPERFELQPKQEWSEEDEEHRQNCLKVIKMKLDEKPYPYYEDYLWLKSLSMNLKKKNEDVAKLCSNEWSEDYREEGIQTRFAFYTYKDEPSVLYLSNVFVEETSRNHGFGTRILKASEKAAEAIGAITIRLKVKRDSFANTWYRKNGYDYICYEGEYDWLEKTLEHMKPNKQEWSEEDVDEIVCLVEKLAKDYEFHLPRRPYDIYGFVKDILKHIKHKTESQVVGLSENDVDAIVKAYSDNLPLCGEFQTYHDALVEIYRQGIVTALKSLRPQPHTVSIKNANKFAELEYERGVKDGIQSEKSHHWKPSEDQIKALTSLIKGTHPNIVPTDLSELLAKLKQLYYNG